MSISQKRAYYLKEFEQKNSHIDTDIKDNQVFKKMKIILFPSQFKNAEKEREFQNSDEYLSFYKE